VTIGPVQLVMLGCASSNDRAEILDGLERLREDDTVRVLDLLAVYKDADGEVSALKAGNAQDARGAVVEALIGLGAQGNGGSFVVSSEDDAWTILDDIPNDSVAGLVLLEHRWAIPLRDAFGSTGGFRIGGVFVSPRELAEVGLAGVGLAAAEEADVPTRGRVA